MREISVRGDHITLGQLLKVAGFVGTGGEVKYFLQETSIKVNGEHDNRRGRKLRPVMRCSSKVVTRSGWSAKRRNNRNGPGEVRQGRFHVRPFQIWAASGRPAA